MNAANCCEGCGGAGWTLRPEMLLDGLAPRVCQECWNGRSLVGDLVPAIRAHRSIPAPSPVPADRLFEAGCCLCGSMYSRDTRGFDEGGTLAGGRTNGRARVCGPCLDPHEKGGDWKAAYDWADAEITRRKSLAAPSAPQPREGMFCGTMPSELPETLPGHSFAQGPKIRYRLHDAVLRGGMYKCETFDRSEDGGATWDSVGADGQFWPREIEWSKALRPVATPAPESKTTAASSADAATREGVVKGSVPDDLSQRSNSAQPAAVDTWGIPRSDEPALVSALGVTHCNDCGAKASPLSDYGCCSYCSKRNIAGSENGCHVVLDERIKTARLAATRISARSPESEGAREADRWTSWVSTRHAKVPDGPFRTGGA